MAQFLISAFADEASDSLDGQIKALRRNGIRYIEPRNVNGSIIQKTDAELFDIANTLTENGIGVSSLGSPIGKFDIDRPFEEHLADFRRALRACEILGTKNMRMFSFFVEPEEYDTYRDEVMRRLGIMLEEAKAAGVTLCHENEHKIYGEAPERVRDLLETFPELRGIFDAANYVRQGHDPIEGFEATKSSLIYVHVKDAMRENRVHVPVGMGDGSYEEVLRRVDALTERTVMLTVEPHLFDFAAYKSIDMQTMDTALDFENSDQSFDCAVSSLKNLLTKIGFKEGEDKIWRK
jgi:sugar phosphate isomerase/epimerase